MLTKNIYEMIKKKIQKLNQRKISTTSKQNKYNNEMKNTLFGVCNRK